MTGTIQQHPDVLTEVVDGEAVVLTPSTGVLHRLEPVAAQVWLELDRARGVDDLVATLSARFDVAPQRVDGDVRRLLAELDAAGLLLHR